MYLKKLINFLKELKQNLLNLVHYSRLNNELLEKSNKIAKENSSYLQSSQANANTLPIQLPLEFYKNEILAQIAQATPGIPLLHGYKIFSQCDEDGIIKYILSILEQKIHLSKTFIEFGCGNGLENNTHALLLDGFSGCWIEGNPVSSEFIIKNIGESTILKVFPYFVTLENIPAIINECIDFLDSISIDFLSMDLDGNDFHFMKEILQYISPKLICVEYNGNFPPPLNLVIPYNPNHRWQGNDYYGASLQAWIKLLDAYKLVSCNLSGANAFFVRNEFADAFKDYSIDELYQPPRYDFQYLKAGHIPTYSWLQNILKKKQI